MPRFASWYFPSIIALLFYGAWGYWGTRASGFLNALSITVYSSLGVVVAGFIALSLLGFKLDFCPRGSMYGVLNGLANGIGCIFFIIAVGRGPSIPVVLITSMYPLVTLMLCVFFLDHSMTVKQVIGMFFAVMALIFFALDLK